MSRSSRNQRRNPGRRPADRSTRARSSPRRRKPTTTRTPSRSAHSSRSQRKRTGKSPTPTRGVARDRWRFARYLWATVAALLLAALLLEPTLLWMIGVGLWMLANGELIGLWMLVVGYVMACIPWAIGLLIATGRFWRSMTHALWIGALYAVIGTLLLERLVGLTS